MSGIADRLLVRIAGKATAEAVCNTTTYCHYNHIYIYKCCPGQGRELRRTGDICNW
ncbi:hypothetical protein ACFOY4_07545 [Actinomadura syzygii]|uniref:hypothetical protein n=1 Tax=Actinomadura syzygii TaxID=1427538 RepID=UPI0016523654|nr:hypothetical protein [Actinomadura syzygii]